MEYIEVKHFVTDNENEAIAIKAALIYCRNSSYIDCVKTMFGDNQFILTYKMDYKENIERLATQQDIECIFNQAKEYLPLVEEIRKSNLPYVFFFNDDREPSGNGYGCKYYTDYDLAECIALSDGSMPLNFYQRAFLYMPDGKDMYGNMVEEYESEEFIKSYKENQYNIKEYVTLRLYFRKSLEHSNC